MVGIFTVDMLTPTWASACPYAVRSIIRRHGERIWVDTLETPGARFGFSVPFLEHEVAA